MGVAYVTIQPNTHRTIAKRRRMKQKKKMTEKNVLRDAYFKPYNYGNSQRFWPVCCKKGYIETFVESFIYTCTAIPTCTDNFCRNRKHTFPSSSSVFSNVCCLAILNTQRIIHGTKILQNNFVDFAVYLVRRIYSAPPHPQNAMRNG